MFWSFFTTFPQLYVLFLSCKANARVKLSKSGHGSHLFRIIVFCVVLVIVLCYCLYAVLFLLCCTVIVLLCYYLCCPMYWLCVLYHCHRVLTQLQLTNISISISRKQILTPQLSHCNWLINKNCSTFHNHQIWRMFGDKSNHTQISVLPSVCCLTTCTHFFVFLTLLLHTSHVVLPT